MLILVCCIILVIFIPMLGYRAHVADWGNFFINVIDGWIRIYCKYYHHFQYQNIPVSEKGPALLACNHLSGLDPFLMVAACHRPIRFMMAKEEYQRFGLQWLFRAAGCIPVERSGRVETAFRSSLSALHDGEIVALFPEGTIHRHDNPPRKLKPGIVKLAKLTSLPITVIQVGGMRAQGTTVTAIFIPGRCTLHVMPELNCGEQSLDTCLTQLALYLQVNHE